MDRRAAEAGREGLDATTARRFSFVELPEPLKKGEAEMWKQMTMVVLLSGLMIFSGVGKSYAQPPRPMPRNSAYNNPKPPTDDGTPLPPLAPVPTLGEDGANDILGICDGPGDYPFDPAGDGTGIA